MGIEYVFPNNVWASLIGRVKKHHAKVGELECIKAQILSESISYVKISDRVNHFANLPKKIVQRLKKNGVVFEIMS